MQLLQLLITIILLLKIVLLTQFLPLQVTKFYYVSNYIVNQFSLNSGNLYIGSVKPYEFVYFSVDVTTNSFSVEITGAQVFLAKDKLPLNSQYITTGSSGNSPSNVTVDECITTTSIPGRWYIGVYVTSNVQSFALKAILSGVPSCTTTIASTTSTSTTTDITTDGTATTSTTSGASTSSSSTSSSGQVPDCESNQCDSTYASCSQSAFNNSTMCSCIQSWGECLVSISCGNGLEYTNFVSTCDSYGCDEEQCSPVLNSVSDARQLYVGISLWFILFVVLFKV